MSRKTESKCKLCRREQTKLFLKGERCYGPKCALTVRQTLPGMHGSKPRRLSNYGVQLREKQKVKRIYSVSEKQFRRYLRKASKSRGNTGYRLLQLLELRLDNVVYRLGYTPSRAMARQLISHGHIEVNGKKVNIPSYEVSVGDIVTIKKPEMAQKLAQIESAKEPVPKWLKITSKGGEVAREPERSMIDEGIKEQLIIEYYSR